MSMWRPLPRTRSALGKTDRHGELASADTIRSLPHLDWKATHWTGATPVCAARMQHLLAALIDNDPGPCEAAGKRGKS